MTVSLTEQEKDLLKPTELEIRVRYPETDRMGVVYHGNYFTWFEMGRTDHLRQKTGISYRDLEESKTLFMVIKVECEYKKPALYDDLLTLKTSIVRMTAVRIEHLYELYRGNTLLAIAKTTVVCVNDKGKVCPVPDWILKLKPVSIN